MHNTQHASFSKFKMQDLVIKSDILYPEYHGYIIG